MPRRSDTAALVELEEKLGGATRHVDLALVFRHKLTGAELLRVGGRWDRVASDYLDADPADLHTHEIGVNENQAETVLRFREWLDARISGAPRKRLLLMGGDRRGGKSFTLTALSVAACIALPGCTIFLVSPTLKRRGELERYTKAHAPAEWRTYSVRDLSFVFANNSRIVNVTGDDAEDLKRGEAEIIALNEPQMMGEDVMTYGLPAIIDRGGLILAAGNPARRRKGVWFTRLVRAIENGTYTKGDFCRLSAKDNPNIDANAKGDVGELLRLMNPEAARADDDGVFLEPGNFAYAESFEERRNTVPTFPRDVRIVTAEVLARIGGADGSSTLVGCDFNGWPWNAGVQVEATGSPSDPTWYVRSYLTREGDEDFFLDDAYGLWRQDRTLVVGDASGDWQNSHHSRGRSSFDKFKARHWRIIPPQQKKSDRGEYAANPPREDRINHVNALLRRGKLIVCMDTAAPVAESLQRCEVDAKGRPRGRHSHLTDALGYPLWFTRAVAEEEHNYDLTGFGGIANFQRSGSPFPTR